MKTLKTTGIMLILAIGQITATHAAEVKISASDGRSDDQFGFSVSIDGDTAIVGTPQQIFPEGGTAYIFQRSGTSWPEQQKLTANDAARDDDFGWSVAVSGDTAIVGARQEDDGGSDSGSAYVFLRTGSSWIQQAELTSGSVRSVAISGDYAIVGNRSVIHSFLRSGSSWIPKVRKNVPFAQGVNNFGSRVAISDDYTIVGSTGGGVETQGSVYIYTPKKGTCDISDLRFKPYTDYVCGMMLPEN